MPVSAKAYVSSCLNAHGLARAWPRRSLGQLGSNDGFYLEMKVHRLLPSLRGEAGNL
jgi:hypothetical protein